MGFLENFEKGLERLVNGVFTKTFQSELAPVEIAGAIRSEMDSKSAILSRDRILAPNTYVVRLSSPDFKRMQQLGEELITELTALATKHASKQGFQFGAALQIKLVEDGSLAIGEVRATSTSEKLEIEWTPALDHAGKRYLIKKARTSVGRDSSADIQIDDPGLSRKHFEIVWDGSKAGIRDLGSTNGTRVSGKTVSETAIAADTAISAGRSDFVFRIVAKTLSPEQVTYFE